VRSSSFSLQFASDELKIDQEVVLQAVKKHGTALEYADEFFCDDTS
jgi:hypothetical protein